MLFLGNFLNHSVDMLSSVPKCKKAVVCFIEKIHVLDKLCSAKVLLIGCEFKKLLEKVLKSVVFELTMERWLHLWTHEMMAN